MTTEELNDRIMVGEAGRFAIYLKEDRQIKFFRNNEDPGYILEDEVSLEDWEVLKTEWAKKQENKAQKDRFYSKASEMAAWIIVIGGVSIALLLASSLIYFIINTIAQW